jgi:hypothetical protein
MTQKLALAPNAGVDETPASYLSRLAASNFVSAREFAKDFALSFQSIVDGCGREIQKLSDLGGAVCQDLMRNAVRRTGSGFALGSEEIAKDSIRRVRVCVCPACIAKDIATSGDPPGLAAYGRAAWRFHRSGLASGIRSDWSRSLETSSPEPVTISFAISLPQFLV